MQGIVVAGTHSGCGKTTITLGILAALKKKGYKVQSFKAGPDFIDTGLHKLVTGRTSRNLDLWMCGSDYVQECFQRHTSDADIAVIEGVMGMYDGNHSTADLAAALGLPVVLVVDAYGMAESAGAIVKGFTDYGNHRGNKARLAPALAGVIFNRVASERHYIRLKESVQGVPVLGYLPRNLEFKIPHRHLGLVVAEESPIDSAEIDRLADAILDHVDVDLIVRKSKRAKERKEKNSTQQNKTSGLTSLRTSSLKIAVAYDKAFCFYYEDNLDLLKNEGAEIVTFSPLSDNNIPEGIDALYIGGGYPELHAAKLSANISMLESVNDFACRDGTVYSECGGFMYLTEGIYDLDNVFHSMAGVFPFETRMTKGRAGLGYREAVLKVDSVLGQMDSSIRGHEFHYSEIVKSGQHTDSIYMVKDGSDNYIYEEGYRVKHTLGSYIHIHFGSNQSIAKNFINYAKEHYGTYTSGGTRQS
jgi:cobyrinic acid a,c-diamide synthase